MISDRVRHSCIRANSHRSRGRGHLRLVGTAVVFTAALLISLGLGAASAQTVAATSAAPSLLPAHGSVGVPPTSAEGPADAPIVDDWALLPAQADEAEPIAYIGHGAFFDRSGRQIVPTAEFVAETQSWYRVRLLAGLSREKQAGFAAFEHRLLKGIGLDEQTKLVVNQRSLDWLMANSPRTAFDDRLVGKLNALKVRLLWRLPRRDDLDELRRLEPFELNHGVVAKLRLPEFQPGPLPFKLATTNSGQNYIDECASWDVPIPPSIGVLDPLGLAGWKSLGFIPTGEQFIVGTPAEVRVFESADGMCIALPRYTNGSLTTVALDGVICLSQVTSKVCIWDNQMSGAGFDFASSSQIPIGLPNLAVDPLGRSQAGGAELVGGSGGVCTDCHAGENPYIIHPNSNLGGGVFMGDLGSAPLNLPTFAPNRYDPIVGASWPQNALSHSQPLVPAACGGCHTNGGIGGRFPHLSSDLPGYCGTILAQALTDTMPPSSPGSQSGTAAITAFQAYCGTPPSAGPSNRGDPHLTTTNNVHYDFQAAGEFTSLRNSASGFELQTRQTPVLTTFMPGPNAHTGLASCVSLNTAAAFRVGDRRISYQPLRGSAEHMQLRIDGAPVTLPGGGIDLGGGNWIANAVAGGGIEVDLADGTRVIVTPNYWTSQGYWYLNVEVLDSPAREGTMGPILGSDWLPKAPNGSSFGPAPVGLNARHVLLNHTFANAWRITDSTSLFAYDPGTSTATFIEKGWPPPPGSPCDKIPSNPWPDGGEREPVVGMSVKQAEGFCRIIEDQTVFKDCVFDLTALGEPTMADAFWLTLQLRALP